MFADETLPRSKLEAEIAELHDKLLSRIAAISERLQVEEDAPPSVLTHQ